MRQINGGHSGGLRVRESARLLLAVGVVLGGVLVAPAAAMAVGGNCSAVTENVSLTGPDGKRAKARCSSLESDSKARGTLDLVSAPDKQTVWFTGINTDYRSGYDRGPNRGSYTTIARV